MKAVLLSLAIAVAACGQSRSEQICAQIGSTTNDQINFLMCLHNQHVDKINTLILAMKDLYRTQQTQAAEIQQLKAELRKKAPQN